MMTDRSRTGERQNPQSGWRVTARFADWEPIRGFHQGQRLANTPRSQAAHMTAHDLPQRHPKNSLASLGPSTHPLRPLRGASVASTWRWFAKVFDRQTRPDRVGFVGRKPWLRKA
jgi:hypothetical protein